MGAVRAMSLRTRLLAGTGLVAVVLIAAAVAVIRITEAHLLDQVDRRLEGSVPEIRSWRHEQVFGDEAAGPDGDSKPDDVDDDAHLDPFYVGAVLPDDPSLHMLVVPDDNPLPNITADDVLAAHRNEAFTVGSAGSDLQYRAIVLRNERLDALMVVARPLDDVDAAVERLLLVELLATGAILLTLGLVTWWVVRLGVRPIRQMTTTASAIADGDLTRRVDEVRPGTEAGELGTALNTMLGHIEDSFAQQAESEARLRRFVADASHELRTPLATIRGYTELYRNRGLPPGEDLDDAMRRTEEEALRMSNLVEDLVMLARFDQGRPLKREPVSLGGIIRDAARDARAVDPSRRVTIAVDPVQVRGDHDRLRQVVANLVGNALVHTPPGTPIDLRVGPDDTDDDRAVIEVTDHGPGMAEPDASNAFERFYRADPGRSRHRGGSGLGLAIVHSTVLAHDGEVILDSQLGRGTTVRVRLPKFRDSCYRRVT